MQAWMTKKSKESPESILMGQVLARGAFGRCPRCGHGKLFKSYLKQVAGCAACGEPLGHIRADDGPAWLTILLTGHILAPLILALEPNTHWPEWVSMTVWPLMALVLAVSLLPRSKGIFIGLIWRAGCIGSEK
jgi:uncharacterized protein (DUF983 family)